MKKIYEAPELFVDEYVADTMIASGGSAWEAAGGIGPAPKNGNAGNNQNCWGARCIPGAPDPSNPENACSDTPDNKADGSDYGICY